MATKKEKKVKEKAQDPRNSVPADQPKTIDFHYLKAPDFRSVHIDGAIGGLTSKGFLHMALFAERSAIPRKVAYNVLPGGKLGDEIEGSRESKQGIIREMEIDLIMNEETAIELRIWLDQNLEEFEKRRKILKKRKTSAD